MGSGLTIRQSTRMALCRMPAVTSRSGGRGLAQLRARPRAPPLYDSEGERAHRPDHGRRRGHADALVGAEGAAPDLRAADDRLAVLAAREAGAARVCVIVSPDRDLSAALPEGTETVVQPKPDGTGGAVRAALDLVGEAETVVVMNGDHPLVSGRADRRAWSTPTAAAEAAATVVTRRPRRPRVARPRRPRLERRVRAHRRDQAPGGHPAGGAGDPRGEHEHVRVRGRGARRRPGADHGRQPGRRVLHRRRAAGAARAGRARPRSQGGRRERQHRHQHARRARRRQRRGAPAHPRAPHARRGHDRRPDRRPGSTPRSRSSPTP